ncbi:hypothetical protein K466DRAFT_274274 [Polyporus arcularius HHB13444]|uniref:Uncharacterized protein n=1 Tax=Polyporus arcularius HHB13444 TaxID=1314778 RepID=A0A5C3PTK7_9APHY|nr:hypothetical protein K466DRAFT_274274 [Polyporus arcularius HHB13444]
MPRCRPRTTVVLCFVIHPRVYTHQVLPYKDAGRVPECSLARCPPQRLRHCANATRLASDPPVICVATEIKPSSAATDYN